MRPESNSALGINFYPVTEDIFKVNGNYILNIGIESYEGRKNNTFFALKALGRIGARSEILFSISTEQLKYGIIFSIKSRSLSEVKTIKTSLEACLRTVFDKIAIKTLPAQPSYLIFPIGGQFVIKRFKDSLIGRESDMYSAFTLLVVRKEKPNMKTKKMLRSNIDRLENFLRSLIDSKIKMVYNVVFKPIRGILKPILSKDFYYSYIFTVVSEPAKSINQAYLNLRTAVEAVRSSFYSSFPEFKIKKAFRWNVVELARQLLTRSTTNKIVSTADLAEIIEFPELKPVSYQFEPFSRPFFEPPDPSEYLREKGLHLGNYIGRVGEIEVKIGIRDLSSHLAIFGTTGSGKTYLAKRLIKQYLKLNGKVMVFDRHGEYGDIEELNIIDPCSGKFKINILDHQHEDPSSFVKKLVEVFSVTYPDEFGPLISGVFRESYLKFLRAVESGEMRLNLGNFVEFLKNQLRFGFESPELSTRKAQDRFFSLIARLTELTTGSISRVFNSERSSVSIDRLLKENIAFDLASMDSDRDANLFTWIVLNEVYNYRKRNPCRDMPHVLIIEEAHQIAPAKFEGQPIIIEYILRELRKFGESVWIIDQRPLNVSRDVLSLCSSIVCLRLQYISDVEKIGDTMHLTFEQKKYLQRLKKGEAIALIAGTRNPIPINLGD